MATLVEQIREQMKSRYLSSLGPNAPVPPERVLMQEFSVSRTTLRKAMQGLVDEGFLQRYPGRGTFVVDPSRSGGGRGAIADRPVTIGFIAPRLGESMDVGWIDAVIDRLYRDDASAMIGLSRWDPLRELELLRQMVQRQAAGLLLWPCHVLHESATLQRQVEGLRLGAALPCVTLGRSNLYQDASSVWFDEEHGGYTATRHLIELGHKRIAHVSFQHHTDAADRTRGYRRAMAEAGLDVPSGYEIDIVNVPKTDVSMEMGRNVARLLLALPEPPTAVFAYWSEIAAGILLEAVDRGLRVPDDLALIGVGTSLHEKTRQLLPTSVSMVWYDMNTAGERAADLLLQQINGQTEKQILRLPSELHVGGSSVKS